MKTKQTLQRHYKKCLWRHPPGDEIYRHPHEVHGKTLSMFEGKTLSTCLKVRAQQAASPCCPPIPPRAVA